VKYMAEKTDNNTNEKKFVPLSHWTQNKNQTENHGIWSEFRKEFRKKWRKGISKLLLSEKYSKQDNLKWTNNRGVLRKRNSKNYKKYIKEPKELIDFLNGALLLAKEGLISWDKYLELRKQVMKKLKEEYMVDVPSCFL